MNFRRVVGIFSVVSTIMSFYACGDDKSSSANSLPDEVADKAELKTYECDMSIIGGKVFVKSLDKYYECDGDEWFESYDQPKSSAKGKSSSSSKGKSSSSGKVSSSSGSVLKQSSGNAESSSSENICTTCEYDVLIDERDGQTYKTVQIGSQWWMAENLNYAYLRPTEQVDSSSCCYRGDPERCEKYGRLYLWSAVMDSVGEWSENGKNCGYKSNCTPKYPVRGICPLGWHIPEASEWMTLFEAVGGWKVAARMLKSTSEVWKHYDRASTGLDPFGFNALPAGAGVYGADRKSPYPEFSGQGDFGESRGTGFASSSDVMPYMDKASFAVEMDSLKANYWYPVRCVKDE